MKSEAKMLRDCVKRANARQIGFWERWDIFWNAPAGGFSEFVDRFVMPLFAILGVTMLGLVVLGVVAMLIVAVAQ